MRIGCLMSRAKWVLYHLHLRTLASPPASTALPAASRDLKTHVPSHSNRVSGFRRSPVPPRHPQTSSITPAESGTICEALVEPDGRSSSSTSTIYRCANVCYVGLSGRSTDVMPTVGSPACPRVSRFWTVDGRLWGRVTDSGFAARCTRVARVLG